MENSEEKLIVRAQKGDEKAFKLLYEKYTPKLYTFISSRVSIIESEDLLSLIWEKAIKHLGSFKYSFENSFAVWIFTIARNALYNFYKKEALISKISLDEVAEIHLVSKENKVLDSFEIKRVQSFIDQLPPQQAETIKLKYFSDFKNKEIAQILNISEKTVASNLSRALQKLLKLMQ